VSDTAELLAKARELDKRLPEGPWQVEGTSGGQADIADNRGTWIATIRKDFAPGDNPLLVELRNILPELIAIAEAEGQRAGEAEGKLAVALSDLRMARDDWEAMRAAAGSMMSVYRNWKMFRGGKGVVMLHRHRCNICGFLWQHAAVQVSLMPPDGQRRAHTCQGCGHVQKEIDEETPPEGKPL